MGVLGKAAFVRCAIGRDFESVIRYVHHVLKEAHLRPQTFSAFSNTCTEKNPICKC